MCIDICKIRSLRRPSHNKRHFWSILTRYLRPQKMALQLRRGPIGELERKVVDQHGKNDLETRGTEIKTISEL
jgi:hypothetical protein